MSNLNEETVKQDYMKRAASIAMSVGGILGKDYEVTPRARAKNNGAGIEIVIRGREELLGACVDILPDMEAGIPDWKIAAKISRVYQNRPKMVFPELSREPQKMKEYILQNVIPQLVSTINNREFLIDKVCIPFDATDLSLLFRVPLPSTGEAQMSFLVTKDMRTHYDLDIDSLFRKVQETPYTIRPMNEMILELREKSIRSGGYMENPEILKSTVAGKSTQDEMDMLIISNENSFFGAGVLANKNSLREASDMLGGRLIIFPCSVHKVIVASADVAGKLGFRTEELRGMVLGANASVIEPEDRLSDNIYLYDPKENIIRILI